MNLFDMSGKVCLVTGALGLLGKAHCTALQTAGGSVIVTDLDEIGCIDYANTLGSNCFGKSLDITSQQSIDKICMFIETNFGKIDVLINNASINEKVEDSNYFDVSQHEPHNFDINEWNRLVNVNLTGTYMLTRSIGKIMCEQKSGSIINIGSTYGIVAPNQNLYKDKHGNQLFIKSAAYPATKSAIVGLTKYFASYYGSFGVRVNTLSPGGVLNGQNDDFVHNYVDNTLLKRMAHPSDYMGPILFLASNASIYMTGANLVVDGGYCAI